MLCENALQLAVRVLTTAFSHQNAGVFAQPVDHREWEAELTKGFHRDRSRYKKNKPWQKKRKWHMTHVPNAAVGGEPLGGVWTCSKLAMLQGWTWKLSYLECQGLSQLQRAGDMFSRFPTWNSSKRDLFLRALQLQKWAKQLQGEPRKKVEHKNWWPQVWLQGPLLPWEVKVNFIAIFGEYSLYQSSDLHSMYSPPSFPVLGFELDSACS